VVVAAVLAVEVQQADAISANDREFAPVLWVPGDGIEVVVVRSVIEGRNAIEFVVGAVKNIGRVAPPSGELGPTDRVVAARGSDGGSLVVRVTRPVRVRSAVVEIAAIAELQALVSE